MIPVPSFQVIEFLRWLSEREFGLRDRDLEMLVRRAGEFLHSNPQQDDTLTQLLWVFQTCPMIREGDVVSQMEHFAQCGHCIDYIDREGIFVRAPASLHPLLLQFRVYLSRCALAERGAWADESIGRSWLADRDPERFHHLICAVGDELREEFRHFIECYADTEVVGEYEACRRHRRYWTNGSPEQLRLPSGETEPEDGTRPITRDEPLDVAAHRLANSARLMLTSDFYAETLASRPELRHALSLIADLPENAPQALEFISWLTKEHPQLDIAGDIPSEKLAELAVSFCEQVGYKNASTFASHAAAWLRGEAPRSLLDRLWQAVANGRTGPDKRRSEQTPFQRYSSVKMHGIFLFASTDDFPKFIDLYWKDLNALTGDALDVYFSKKDLKARVSGWDARHEFRSLTVSTTEIPGLVLWRHEMAEAQVICLARLSHAQVFEVLKHVVQAIEDGGGLDAVAQRGRTIAEELVAKSGGITMNQSTFITNSKGIITAGPHASSQGHTYIEQAQEALSDELLGTGDAEALDQLVGDLKGSGLEHIEEALRLELQLRLVELRDAAKQQDRESQIAAVSKWKEFWGCAKVHLGATLATTGNLASLSSLLIQVLGLRS